MNTMSYPERMLKPPAATSHTAYRYLPGIAYNEAPTVHKRRTCRAYVKIFRGAVSHRNKGESEQHMKNKCNQRCSRPSNKDRHELHMKVLIKTTGIILHTDQRHNILIKPLSLQKVSAHLSCRIPPFCLECQIYRVLALNPQRCEMHVSPCLCQDASNEET